MPDTTTLLKAFDNNDFQEAKTILENSPGLQDHAKEFERKDIFAKILRGQAFDLVPLLLTRQLIEKDIYEYERFDNSIFSTIVYHNKVDDEFTGFLDEFFSSLENINDEVNGETLLGFAISKGADIGVIKSLVHAGCDVNYKDNAEQTYLHRIPANRMLKPEKALAYMEFLISEGIDVNATDISHHTALLLAVSKNEVAQIDLLLQNGANCNDQDKAGESAFYHAVIHQQNYKLYSKLKEYDSPSLNEANKEGKTILYEFIRRLDRPDEALLSLLKELIEDGADLLQTSLHYEKEQTPLDAAAGKKFEVFKVVIDADKVEINEIYEDGNTLLHKVCGYNINYDQVLAKDTYRKVKLLIEKGADVNITNNQDQTALMLASEDNLKSKTVELLLAQPKS